MGGLDQKVAVITRGARGIGKQIALTFAEEGADIVVGDISDMAAISEVSRCHQIHHTQFYRWERLARQGALEALRNGARKTRNGKREEWLVSELNRLRVVVAELTAENLTLKRGVLV